MTTPPPRNIVEVGNQVAAILADNGVDPAGFRKILRDSCYAAPENQQPSWVKATFWLTENVPNPYDADAPAYTQQVLKVWNGP